MEEFPHGIALAWSFPPVPAVLILLTAVLYRRGWRKLQLTRSRELPRWRAASFLAGLTALWIALASPIDALDDFLLSAHMIQHFLLMSVVPPLLVLGAPTVPLLRGLPRPIIRSMRPLFTFRPLHALAHTLTRPIFAWLLMNLAYLGWHTPAAFDLTLRSETWHNTEHLTFLFTNILFWWVVIAPWPSRRRSSQWIVIPYLVSADLVNTALSAVLVWSGRVLYAPYEQAVRIFKLSPLQDQILAGSEMWVLNSVVFLVPVAILIMQLLSPRSLRSQTATISRPVRPIRPIRP